MRWWIKAVLFVYLSIAAATDIKKKTVSVRLALVFGALAAAAGFLARTDFPAWAAGALPGIFLLAAAWLTHESVGYGDGCVLLVTGLFTGFSAGAGILMTALLLLCPVSLVLLIWKRDRRRTLPFVPFLLAAYIVWLIF